MRRRWLSGPTSQSDIRNLLVVPTATDVAVVPWEPDLLQVGLTPGEALPQRGPEGVAWFVEGERLKRVLHLVGDLGVGKGPCAGCVSLQL